METMASGSTNGVTTAGLDTSGGGGNTHRFLQQAIKRFAEGKGYRVELEKEILRGVSRTDVVLEKQGVMIACEISVSSTPVQELGHIQACLRAGFHHVIVIAPDEPSLGQLSKRIWPTLERKSAKRVEILTPEGFYDFLERLEGGTLKTTARPQDGAQKGLGLENLLTAQEVSDILGISVKTIYSYVQRGLMPYVKIQSNVRFHQSDIREWVSKQTYRPPSVKR
jgi:excisionase family DNA binding protein